MNIESFSSKTLGVKALIVTAFFATIALIVWASVQLVALIPSSFSSLASLAGSIDQYREAVFDNDALTITSALSTIENTKPATITWKKDSRPGTYTFSYSCLDGVSVELVSPEGMRAVSCDMRYSLGDTDSLTLVVDSEKAESVQLSYAISFMRENDIGPIRIGEQTLSITPSPTSTPTVASNPSAASTDEKNGDVFVKDEIVAIETQKPVTTTPAVSSSPEPKVVYTLPVSNPNGFTDLATRFINTGSIVDNKFVAGSIERGENGAIQFEVKNIGTKTSTTWSYTITLPDGDTYTSPKQVALKPNERAVVSLGFDTPNKASYTFIGVVQVTDAQARNNSFKKVVNFSNER